MTPGRILLPVKVERPPGHFGDEYDIQIQRPKLPELSAGRLYVQMVFHFDSDWDNSAIPLPEGVQDVKAIGEGDRFIIEINNGDIHAVQQFYENWAKGHEVTVTFHNPS